MSIAKTLKAALIASALALALGSPRPARAELDAWPLFETDASGTTVLYPLYVHEGPFLMVFPLYARTNEAKDHHILWPLVKVSEGHLDRVAPLWFSANQGEYTLFPLYSRNEERTISLIPPMYTSADGSQFTIVPFYSKSRREISGRGTQERVSALWPLYRRGKLTDPSGRVIEHWRSFLIFTDSRDAAGTRRLSIFGLPVSERVE